MPVLANWLAYVVIDIEACESLYKTLTRELQDLEKISTLYG